MLLQNLNLSLLEESALQNLPSELLLMIFHRADIAEDFSFIEKRKMIASLRNTCRIMNQLFSKKFFDRYLSKLVVGLDEHGLKNLKRATKFGMGQHVKSLEIDASTMIMDDPYNRYQLKWDDKFLQVHNNNTLNTTITSCVPSMKNLEVLTFRPPQATPFRGSELELLQSRWSSVVELLTLIALTHAQNLIDINIQRAFHDDSFMACYASMSISLHIFHPEKLFPFLTTLSLNLRLNIENSKQHCTLILLFANLAS